MAWLVGALAIFLLASLGIIYWQGLAIEQLSSEKSTAQPTSSQGSSRREAPSPTQKEERLRALVNAMPDGILVVDERGIIELANPNASYIFSYIPGELPGHDIGHLLPALKGSEGQDFRDRLKAQSDDTASSRRELQGQKKSGESVQLELTIGELQLPNDQHHYTCNVRDISERKKIQRMRAEMMSLVSHGLRDPLAAITGALRLMQHSAKERLSQQDLTMLAIANRNTDRLIRLINELLELEQLDGGVAEVPVGAIALTPVIQKVCATLSPKAKTKDVHIRCQKLPEEAIVMANESQLQKVFTHLLTNAIAVSPKGKEILVAIEHKQEQFEVSIQDQGPGIPKELQARIFDRFAHGESAERGTGLGLCISKALVDRIGGTIDFTTAEQQGTTFRVSLLEADVAVRRLLTPEGML